MTRGDRRRTVAGVVYEVNPTAAREHADQPAMPAIVLGGGGSGTDQREGDRRQPPPGHLTILWVNEMPYFCSLTEERSVCLMVYSR